jgi:DNA-binding IclR family transcriptional regulator
MVRLGHQLNLTCWLFSADDTHLRVIDQAWHSRSLTPIMRVGERYQLAPALGAVFMAWAGERRVGRWFERGSVTDDERLSYLDRLAEIRARRYAVALEETPMEQLRTLATQLANATTPAERSRLVDQLAPGLTMGSASILTHPDPDEHYSVRSINAPIFDDSGQVDLALGVTNLPLLRGTQILELGRRVRDAAAEVNNR